MPKYLVHVDTEWTVEVTAENEEKAEALTFAFMEPSSDNITFQDAWVEAVED